MPPICRFRSKWHRQDRSRTAGHSPPEPYAQLPAGRSQNRERSFKDQLELHGHRNRRVPMAAERQRAPPFSAEELQGGRQTEYAFPDRPNQDFRLRCQNQRASASRGRTETRLRCQKIVTRFMTPSNCVVRRRSIQAGSSDRLPRSEHGELRHRITDDRWLRRSGTPEERQ